MEEIKTAFEKSHWHPNNPSHIKVGKYPEGAASASGRPKFSFATVRMVAWCGLGTIRS